MRAKKKQRLKPGRPRPKLLRLRGHIYGGSAVIISGGYARRPMMVAKKKN